MSTLRFFVPGLQYFSVMWDFVVRVDFPVSLVVRHWGRSYSALAAIWVVMAGTLWWYLLSRAAETLIKKFSPAPKTSFRLIRRTKASRVTGAAQWHTAILVNNLSLSPLPQ